MIRCPVCGLPAEEKQRFRIRHGPDSGERVLLVCIARHWITLFLRELKEYE